MQTFIPWLLIAPPVLLVLVGLGSRRQSGATASRSAIMAAAAAVVLAVTAAIGLAIGGSYTLRLAPFGAESPIALTLRMDVISATMGLLVAFLGFVVIRFSKIR